MEPIIGDEEEDDDGVPAPVSLGKPRLIAQQLVPVIDHDSDESGETVGEEVSTSSSMFDRFKIGTLLQTPSSVMIGLKEQLLDPAVLREALVAVGDPNSSDLLRHCPNVEEVASKLVPGICEALLETSPQGSHLLRTVVESGGLEHLWKVTELPVPLRLWQAQCFRNVVERCLRRLRVKTLQWMLTPLPNLTESPGSQVRLLPVFRLFRHLESEHFAALVALALDKEIEGTPDSEVAAAAAQMVPRGRGNNRKAPPQVAPPAAPAAESAPSMRWSNKFDIVRVLLHKMRLVADDSASEDTAVQSAVLLTEVLRHSNTHVDLLKNVMSSATSLFELALGVNGNEFHPVQFAAAWSVLLDLLRCLGRIWLPNRHTRIISDTVQVFVSFLPQVHALCESQGERLGFVRMQVAEGVSVMLAGRLVSLFVEPLMKSGLLKLMLDSCIRYPNASLFHQVFLGGALLPMIQNCTPVVQEESDDVFSPAAKAVRACVVNLELWKIIIDNYFSYEEEFEPLRNKFAFNGLLTQLANVLVNSSCPLEGGRVMQFVSSRLDWVNTLENSPLTATVYSKKTRPNDDDVESDDEEHQPDDEKEEDDDSSSEDEDDHPSNNPTHVRVKVLAISNPKPVGDYSSPPRPRISLDEKTEDEAIVAEEIFNEHSYWRLPIQEF